MTFYTKASNTFQRIEKLRSIKNILSWDTATYMPPSSSDTRTEQVLLLSEMIQKELKTPELSQWIESAEKEENLDVWQKANLREIKHQYQHESSLPEDLVQAHEKAIVECELLWRQAREESNFKLLQPSLEEVFRTIKEIAEIKSEKFGGSPYDALLDQFDPGSSSQKLDKCFDQLEGFLPDFIEAVIDKQSKQKRLIPFKGPFKIEKQKELAQDIMNQLGFDFQKGRIDTSTHPFCGGTYGDTRITTRYDEDEFMSSLLATIHETGHGFYEQGLPEKWQFTPVGEAIGSSTHESQSLFFEIQIARNQAFARFLSPLLQKHFNQDGPEWKPENIYGHLSKVERDFIRVDADEVTYPAHVLLRYKIEKALFDDQIKVSDLPDIWNQKMKLYLGITPPNDSLGCLQDIHWPCGAWGYFPTYAIGAMTASQIYHKTQETFPDIQSDIEKGEFKHIFIWLKDQIHSKGHFYQTNDEMLLAVTGQTLNIDIYKNYLKEKFLNS